MAQGTTHFMGVGGIGMSALAAVLIARGETVSGCDTAPSAITDRLAAMGAVVYKGHDAAHLEGVGRLVVSDAIRKDNPELAQARGRGMEVLRRSQLLGATMKQGRGIAVAGSHGKTTITAMLALVLQQAGLDPTVLAGGELEAIGGNYRVGRGEWVLAEACEAYNSFLDLEPEIALIANVEADHLDFHGTFDHVVKAFEEFAGRIGPAGRLVWCADRVELKGIAAAAACRSVSYGLAQGADLRATGAALEGFGSRFEVEGRGAIRLNVPGGHNVLNALGAAACALEAGVPFAAIAAALEQFAGVKRRFQRMGGIGGVMVMDDYAHHPTEIRATLAAARPLCGGRLHVIFQPHLYSRTRDLLDDFAASFDDADGVVFAEIYPAREEPIAGISSALLCQRARAVAPGKEFTFIADKKEIPGYLVARVKRGDWVMTLGAGDVDSVARDVLSALGGGRAEER